MTLIRHVFVIHTTAAYKNAETDAGFELIIKGPGGFQANMTFKDLAYDEREQGRADLYSFDFGEPFDWDPSSGWTASIRMRSTRDGWLPYHMFVLGKVASDIPSEWVVMGAHVQWPKHDWFDRSDSGTTDDHPEHEVSGFTFTLPL